MLPAFLVLLLQASPAPPADAPVRAHGHVIVGDLVRVDVARRQIVVRTGTPAAPTEIDVDVTDETRFTSRGRALRLADLRSGAPVVVVCQDQGARHRADVVKLPKPMPSPRPAPTEAGS